MACVRGGGFLYVLPLHILFVSEQFLMDGDAPRLYAYKSKL